MILDEALAVGDARFQKKCIDRILDLKASGRTIFFCSHALYYISTFCDHALWLRDGEVAAEGDAQKVVLEYERSSPARRTACGKPERRAPTAGTHGTIPRRGSYERRRRRAKSAFRAGGAWAVELEPSPSTTRRGRSSSTSPSRRPTTSSASRPTRASTASGRSSGRSGTGSGSPSTSLPLGKGEFVVYAYLGDETSLALYDSRSDVSFRVESPVWRSGLMRVDVRWDAVG